MRKIRVERYRETAEGPAWDYLDVWIRPKMDGGAFFSFDGRVYEIGLDSQILCNGFVVGRIADWGKTYFLGPKDALTREEHLRAKFEAELSELKDVVNVHDAWIGAADDLLHSLSKKVRSLEDLR